MTTAPLATAAIQPTMCLLHGDFHVMDSTCWGAALDWQCAHPHLEGSQSRDAYLLEVERRMLDNLARSQR
jgi:hypothetical protein